VKFIALKVGRRKNAKTQGQKKKKKIDSGLITVTEKRYQASEKQKVIS